MRATSLGVVVVVGVMAPMSAHAEIAPQLVVSVGAGVGGHHHPDDSGANLGANVDAAARLGMFVVGGSIGYDSFAVLDSVPVHATTIGGRAGVHVPLAASAPGTFRLDGIGALEGGLHVYSPDGDYDEFLGGHENYRGEEASIAFTGARVGTAMTIRRQTWSYGLQLKVELIGRSDLRRADLEYENTSCGGLFADDDDCSTSQGMTRVGGTQLGAMTSVGIVFE
jgi:hypothetical protein